MMFARSYTSRKMATSICMGAALAILSIGLNKCVKHHVKHHVGNMQNNMQNHMHNMDNLTLFCGAGAVQLVMERVESGGSPGSPQLGLPVYVESHVESPGAPDLEPSPGAPDLEPSPGAPDLEPSPAAELVIERIEPVAVVEAVAVVEPPVVEPAPSGGQIIEEHTAAHMEEGEIEVDELDYKCAICYVKLPDTVVEPCGHATFCHDCLADHMNRTGGVDSSTYPFCRTVITGVSREIGISSSFSSPPNRVDEQSGEKQAVHRDVRGHKQGKAIREFSNGNTEEYTYVDGVLQGIATKRYANGDTEQYFYLDGKPDGQAIHTVTDKLRKNGNNTSKNVNTTSGNTTTKYVDTYYYVKGKKQENRTRTYANGDVETFRLVGNKKEGDATYEFRRNVNGENVSGESANGTNMNGESANGTNVNGESADGTNMNGESANAGKQGDIDVKTVKTPGKQETHESATHEEAAMWPTDIFRYEAGVRQGEASFKAGNGDVTSFHYTNGVKQGPAIRRSKDGVVIQTSYSAIRVEIENSEIQIQI
jgi:hypothetical protein